MRRYIVSLTSFAMAALLFSQVATAQDDKDKLKEKTRSNSDEIVIKRKSGKDAKVTIEIKGDEVLVNGKPVDEYNDEDVSIRKRKGVSIITPGSPFRGQSWSYSGDNDLFFGEDVAFLGVVTEKSDKGAKIEEITKESAAAKSGLKTGDVITKIDETKIEDPDDLTKAIRKHKPEEKATITYERDGKENKLSVTLGKRKNTTVYGLATPPTPPADAFRGFDWHEGQLGSVFNYGGRARLGIKAQDTEDGKGVKVLDVEEESAAEKAGLKENDIINEFDGKKVDSADDLSKAAREAKDKITVKVAITRDGKAQTLEIKTPRKLKTTNL